MRSRKSQRVTRTKPGIVSSSSHTIPGLSFATVLRSNTQQQQQPHLHCVANGYAASLEAQPTTNTKTVQTPYVNSSSVNDMFNSVPTIFQHIMTEINGAKSVTNTKGNALKLIK
jgi:hypothetical protein